VDLEQHKIIDLLPDREAATLQAWLQRHPEIQVVSRDRSLTYAEGVTKGGAASPASGGSLSSRQEFDRSL
jgi:transposase